MRAKKKARNVFYDNHGFPNKLDAYNHLLHNIDGGVVLWKKKFDAPALDQDNPVFNYVYSEAKHGKHLKELNLSHLQPEEREHLTALIKKYWCMLDERDTFVPIRHYQCIIDTGSTTPIAIKKIHYGPGEIQIMKKSIATLAKMGLIRQICDGQWLFKTLLAPKPCQERVHNTKDFVWHFCINYIPLNQVTRLIAYPIPPWDNAMENVFGGFWMWFYNAIVGYHQLSVSCESQEKLAFQGPDAIKWTYYVMPFHQTNGPATFIMMIHNVDSVWKESASSLGLPVGTNVDTKIIIDNIINWAKSFYQALKYIECQLRIAKAYRLTLSLKKSHFFPKRFEFVGIDVSLAENKPAMSKQDLLKHWPTPTIVQDVASFVGFLQFYSKFIPCFELCTEPLQNIMLQEYSKPIGDMWTPTVQATFDSLRDTILNDPCLHRFDPSKWTVLRTNFSSKGFGYVVCQPDSDSISLELISQFMPGNGFYFFTKTDGGVLYPVVFGG
jgi:hypothetical protein